MNFARYRPFVLGLTTVRIVGGRIRWSFFCVRTVGSKQGDVGSSYDFKRGVISAQQNSVAAFYADEGARCALPGRVEGTILCGR